jgi:dienelactone hydrolase
VRINGLMSWVTVLALIAQVQGKTSELKAPGFEHLSCVDKFDRRIEYYLSPPTPNKKLPVAVFVLGSGGQSLWSVRDQKVAGGLQNLFLSRVKDHLRVLVVEKPGVQFGFMPPHPGSAQGCSEEFLREHTLERWTEANNAALADALKKDGVDPKRVLAVGHSEGGLVVSSLATKNPVVTHVASLAGGGPNQWADLEKLFGKDAVVGVKSSLASDPMSTSRFIFGHPHRRWTTFTATSNIEQALANRAKYFIAQGTKDTSVDAGGAEELHGALQAAGRDTTLLLIKDGDHGFSTDPQDRTGKGFVEVFDKVLNWFRT